MIEVKLRDILKEKNMSLVELSELTGINTKTLSQFQNKKTESAHYNTISKIATALNISIGDLLENIKEKYAVSIENFKKIENRQFIFEIKYHFYKKETYTLDVKMIVDKFESTPKNNIVFISIVDINQDNIPKYLEIDFKNTNTNIDIMSHIHFFKVISYLLVHKLLLIEDFIDLNESDEVIVSFKEYVYSTFDLKRNDVSFIVSLIERSKEDLITLRKNNLKGIVPRSIADFSKISQLTNVKDLIYDENFSNVVVSFEK
ncbi:helix-turn-helix domain-containing protein [Macrococcus equi]|uniref:helix-turn-helix domain-containing protein n=1 Tax=Macrococcus equi TaxID=3395462 RepID=UPI0039BE8580